MIPQPIGNLRGFFTVAGCGLLMRACGGAFPPRSGRTKAAEMNIPQPSSAATNWPDAEPFDGGGLIWLERRVGLCAPGRPQSIRRALLVVGAGWVPLLVLCAIQSALGQDGLGSFLRDFAVHARSLIAAPILVLAQHPCVAHLSAIARHFFRAGIVSGDQVPRFAAAASSTAAMRESPLAALFIWLVAIGGVVLLAAYVPAEAFMRWQRGGLALGSSPAGWWQIAVSIPLLLALVLDWLWRLFLWTRFLWLCARLKLRLVASHPDRSAGLRFLGYSVQAFSPVGLALGTIAAGTLANRITYYGASLDSFLNMILVLAGLVVILFTAPLLVFVPTLMRVWRDGTLQHGALAGRLGHELERKWSDVPVDESTLGAPDFSATTDLYQVAGNVWDVRVVPVGFLSLAFLAVTTLAPFAVIALMFMPIDAILEDLAGFLI
jgi:hypothetical protein